MSNIITISHLNITFSNGQFLAEASDIGIKPGQWPAIITYSNFRFIYSAVGSPVIENGELVAMEYKDIRTGTVLRVEND